MLKFLLLANKQGQARIAKYYEHVDKNEKLSMESDIIRKCLARNDNQVSHNFLQLQILSNVESWMYIFT